jgi:hypothetical protein
VLTELPVKLINGLARTKSEPDLRAGRTTSYPVSLFRVRSREWKLINGHASKGSWGHQFSDALERSFRHLFCFSRRPRWADDRGVYITFLLVMSGFLVLTGGLLVRSDLRGLGRGPHRCDLEVATAMENAPGDASDFVGERNRQLEAIEPPGCSLDPGLEAVAFPALRLDQHDPCRLNE